MLSFAGSECNYGGCNSDDDGSGDDPHAGPADYWCCYCTTGTWLPESEDEALPWDKYYDDAGLYWTIEKGIWGCHIDAPYYGEFIAQGDCPCWHIQVEKYDLRLDVSEGTNSARFYPAGSSLGNTLECDAGYYNEPSTARTALQHAVDSAEIRQRQQKNRAGGGGGCSSGGCSAPAGPQGVNPAIGNLSIALVQPGGGPFDTSAVLTHHSCAGVPGGWANNWRSSHERDIDDFGEPDGTEVDLITGNGNVYRYTDKDTESGKYIRPAGAKGTLVKTGDTWTGPVRNLVSGGPNGL